MIEPMPVCFVRVSWTTLTEDGSAIGSPEGFRIYHDVNTSERDATFPVDGVNLIDPGTTEMTIPLPMGVRYFEVTATADGGSESQYANGAFKQIP